MAIGNISQINGLKINAENADNATLAVSASYVTSLSQKVNITGSLTTTGSFNITGSISITGSVAGNITALATSGSFGNFTASVDFKTGNFFTLTLNNSANIHIRPTNLQQGQIVYIRVTQNGTGLGTASFPSFVKQPSGSLYTGSQVLGAIDVLSLVTFDTTNVYVNSVRNLI